MVIPDAWGYCERCGQYHTPYSVCVVWEYPRVDFTMTISAGTTDLREDARERTIRRMEELVRTR